MYYVIRLTSGVQVKLTRRIKKAELKRVIVITGTPGIGKTSISDSLASKLGAIHINVGELVTREKITSGYDEARQTLIADTDKLAKRIERMINESRKTVIVDGHYAPEIVPKEDITKVFVLRCHPKQLKQRMIERGFQGPKLKENLAAEVLDVCLTDAIASVGIDRVCEIDTTDRTIDMVVDQITNALEKRKYCAVGIVDWLGQLEVEKTLDQYLQEF